MILSDTKIMDEMFNGNIVIIPFNRGNLGSNSYDVHLGRTLAIYSRRELDAKEHNEIVPFSIPEEGFILQPNQLYLGVTKEYTETRTHVPFLEGKSSVGRLGVDIHATAGKGDVGFCGHWTLEISCKIPVKIYAGMPIGQLIYFLVEGPVEKKYSQKSDSKYHGQKDLPVESMMFKNFDEENNYWK